MVYIRLRISDETIYRIISIIIVLHDTLSRRVQLLSYPPNDIILESADHKT